MKVLSRAGAGSVNMLSSLSTFAGLAPMRDGGASAQPVVLHPAGLINANAVESISSAMEISAIGARNAARLVTEIIGARVV